MGKASRAGAEGRLPARLVQAFCSAGCDASSHSQALISTKGGGSPMPHTHSGWRRAALAAAPAAPLTAPPGPAAAVPAAVAYAAAASAFAAAAAAGVRAPPAGAAVAAARMPPLPPAQQQEWARGGDDSGAQKAPQRLKGSSCGSRHTFPCAHPRARLPHAWRTAHTAGSSRSAACFLPAAAAAAARRGPGSGGRSPPARLPQSPCQRELR